jgi:drug/metabolite transporter (DMT)-like permease
MLLRRATFARVASIVNPYLALCTFLSLPVLMGCVILTYNPKIFQSSLTSWISFGYLSVVSQLLAFFAWYSGLAMGGVVKVSQLQYLQPFITVLASTWLLHEQITAATVGALIVSSDFSNVWV